MAIGRGQVGNLSYGKNTCVDGVLSGREEEKREKGGEGSFFVFVLLSSYRERRSSDVKRGRREGIIPSLNLRGWAAHST